MVLRPSRWGHAYWLDGKLVWDDPLGQRKYVLGPECDAILRFFAGGRSVTELEGSPLADGRAPAEVERGVQALVDIHVLVPEGSPRDLRERAIVERWATWGTAAPVFHFATRTAADAPYLAVELDRRRLETLQAHCPPPPVVKPYEGVMLEPLPPPADAMARLSRVSLADVMRARRSQRSFADLPVLREELGAVLHAAAGLAGDPEKARCADESAFKHVPSGGARHPTEVYPLVRRVDGLEPGTYHYDCERHGLQRVGGCLTDDEVAHLAGGQEWVSHAAVVLLYTAVLDRSTWKYDSGRAYRVMLCDLGHVSQMVYLACAACRLATTFTAATRDETVEDILKIDGISEFPLGLSAIGVPDERT